MITDTGVDILSFGGTKNGFAFGEAIVVFNPLLNTELKFIKKQSAQLPSKSRYLSNQFKTYLTDNLYFKIAQNSVEMALLLYKKLEELKLNYPAYNSVIKVSHKPESNGVFVVLPKEIVKKLREKHFFYVWNELTFECRLMTSWDTTADDIESFMTSLTSLLHLK
jgi:threonine aldolase